MSSFFEHHGNTRARFGFAYVTLSGLDSYLESLRDLPNFQNAEKRWLVGLHHGITEPSALRRLQQLPHSETRLFTPTGQLDVRTLQAQEKFHAKFANAVSDQYSVMILGSANLTRSAISGDATNYEACMVVETSDAGEGLVGYSDFDSWFRELWNGAIPVNQEVIDRYAESRARLIQRQPHVVNEFDEHAESQIEAFENLWIEAGAMSGGDRNQIEFGEKLAAFFGPVTRTQRILRIEYEGQIYADRPLSFKITQWGTRIWRLSLPTSRQSGATYRGNKIIKFRRRSDTTGNYWEIELVPANSSKASRWFGLANRIGSLSVTAGPLGRRYGLY